MNRDLLVRRDDANLLVELVRRDVRFLVIGGVAVRAYCPDRSADDLDVLLDRDIENARRFIAALRELAVFSSIPWTAETIAYGDKAQIESKDAANYLDIITPDPDFDFENAWNNSEIGNVDGTPVRVASPDLLIMMKSDNGRPKDIEDILRLKTYLKQENRQRP